MRVNLWWRTTKKSRWPHWWKLGQVKLWVMLCHRGVGELQWKVLHFILCYTVYPEGGVDIEGRPATSTGTSLYQRYQKPLHPCLLLVCYDVGDTFTVSKIEETENAASYSAHMHNFGHNCVANSICLFGSFASLVTYKLVTLADVIKTIHKHWNVPLSCDTGCTYWCFLQEMSHSPVLSYDPLPPTNPIVSYTRPERFVNQVPDKNTVYSISEIAV